MCTRLLILDVSLREYETCNILNTLILIATLRCRINEVQALHNETQAMLQETKHALKDIVTQGINNIEDRITEGKEETKDSVAALR